MSRTKKRRRRHVIIFPSQLPPVHFYVRVAVLKDSTQLAKNGRI